MLKYLIMLSVLMFSFSCSEDRTLYYSEISISDMTTRIVISYYFQGNCDTSNSNLIQQPRGVTVLYMNDSDVSNIKANLFGVRNDSVL